MARRSVVRASDRTIHVVATRIGLVHRPHPLARAAGRKENGTVTVDMSESASGAVPALPDSEEVAAHHVRLLIIPPVRVVGGPTWGPPTAPVASTTARRSISATATSTFPDGRQRRVPEDRNVQSSILILRQRALRVPRHPGHLEALRVGVRDVSRRLQGSSRTWKPSASWKWQRDRRRHRCGSLLFHHTTIAEDVIRDPGGVQAALVPTGSDVP